jgi:transketolase
MTIKQLQKKAAELRIDTLKMLNKACSGHTGGSMSVMDILVALYYGTGMSGKMSSVSMPKGVVSEYGKCCVGKGRGAFGQGREEDKDYIILSKGHAVPAQYAILADLGYFSHEELGHLRQVGALLQGHPCVKTPGITLATGSLGQGFSAAHGLALSLKLDRRDNKVFVVLGDGELQEGIVWETAMSAGHYMTDNLIAIVDNNGLQIDGPVRAVMNVEPIQDKFESFGWKVIRVLDGHNYEELLDAILKARAVTRRPVCIWCRTIKGKGVPFAENKVSYHGVTLSDGEFSAAEAELRKECERCCD